MNAAELSALKQVAIASGFRNQRPDRISVSDHLENSAKTVLEHLYRIDEKTLVILENDGSVITVTLIEEGRQVLGDDLELYRRLFSSPDMLILYGTVTSGFGDGEHFVQGDGFKNQFKSYLGYTDGQTRRNNVRAF